MVDDTTKSNLPSRLDHDATEQKDMLQISAKPLGDRSGSSSEATAQQSPQATSQPDAGAVNQGAEALSIAKLDINLFPSMPLIQIPDDQSSEGSSEDSEASEDSSPVERPSKEEKQCERQDLVSDDKMAFNLQASESLTLDSQSEQYESPQREPQMSVQARYEAHRARIDRLDHAKFHSMGYQLREDTNKIIEDLRLWGQLRKQIKDKHKELEGHCHEAFAAFGDAYFHPSNPLAASMADLRGILDICLAENAIPEDVEFHLPHVRQITQKLTTDYDMSFGPYINIVDIPKDESGHDDVVGAGPPVDPMDEQAFNPFGPKVSTGRHVPLVKGNDQSKPRPRPPHVFSESDSNQSRQT
ncbi:hypothetical protein ONZ45_g10280 [Pleurotus djamor]|nr:hypothetical protein ONZ45_g10280 [Pleurotus djamor]